MSVRRYTAPGSFSHYMHARNRLGGIIASTSGLSPHIIIHPRLTEIKFDFHHIDYLVLDTLLQVLARLIPSANDVAGRLSLSKDVFQNPKAKKAFGKESCNELAKLLENAKGEEWTKARVVFSSLNQRIPAADGYRQSTDH